jgi:hypothetical protein
MKPALLTPQQLLGSTFHATVDMWRRCAERDKLGTFYARLACHLLSGWAAWQRFRPDLAYEHDYTEVCDAVKKDWQRMLESVLCCHYFRASTWERKLRELEKRFDEESGGWGTSQYDDYCWDILQLFRRLDDAQLTLYAAGQFGLVDARWRRWHRECERAEDVLFGRTDAFVSLREDCAEALRAFKMYIRDPELHETVLKYHAVDMAVDDAETPTDPALLLSSAAGRRRRRGRK